MTLRAATDSGVVVFPRLPVPSQTPISTGKRGQSPRKPPPLNQSDDGPSGLTPARPTWRRLATAASVLLGVGMVAGFMVRPALLPPAELAERKTQVAALLAQQSQTQLQIATLESRDSQRATELATMQTDLTKALQANATLTQAQAALHQTSAAQQMRVAQLNKHLATQLGKTATTLLETPSSVIVRIPDNSFFVPTPSGGAGTGLEMPAPALTVMIDKLDAALAAPPSPLQRLQIRSVVHSPLPPRGRRNRHAPSVRSSAPFSGPVVSPVDPWMQSTLRAAMIGKLLRDRSALAQLTITAAGAGATTVPRANGFVEIEVTLAN